MAHSIAQFEDLRRAVLEQTEVVRSLVIELPDLATTTRLAGWRCRELVAHIAKNVEAPQRFYQEDGNVRGPQLDGANYYDYTALPEARKGNHDYIIAYAGKKSEGEIRNEFFASADAAKNFLAHAAPWWKISLPWKAWISMEDFLITRVLEVTVHGLGLCDAMGVSTRADPVALDVCAAVLDRRLAGPRPSDLNEPVRWIEAATGRTAHADRRLPVVL